MTLKANPNDGKTRELLENTLTRVRELKEQRGAINEEIKLVIQDAKVQGLDSAALKEVIKLMDMDPEKRDEFRGLVEVYLSAVVD